MIVAEGGPLFPSQTKTDWEESRNATPDELSYPMAYEDVYEHLFLLNMNENADGFGWIKEPRHSESDYAKKRYTLILRSTIYDDFGLGNPVI